jgi:hypothetical protein
MLRNLENLGAMRAKGFNTVANENHVDKRRSNYMSEERTDLAYDYAMSLPPQSSVAFFLTADDDALYGLSFQCWDASPKLLNQAATDQRVSEVMALKAIQAGRKTARAEGMTLDVTVPADERPEPWSR